MEERVREGDDLGTSSVSVTNVVPGEPFPNLRSCFRIRCLE
jgi:hypothetical protein